MTTIELVRHAEASQRDQWWGRPDRDRPLTELGRDQARALARELPRAGPIEALYSSPHVRCLETIGPLGSALGLDVVDEEGLAESMTLPVLDGGDAWVASAWLAGRALSLLNRVVRSHPEGRVVACSHGDVIPALMAALAGRDRIDISDVRCRKGGWFTLTFDDLRCVRVLRNEPPEV